VSSPQQC